VEYGLRRTNRRIRFLLGDIQIFVCGRWRWGIVWRWSEKLVIFGSGYLTLDTGFLGGASLAVAVAPVVTVTTVILAVAYILHLAIAVGAPGAVAVAALGVFALSAVVLPGRGLAVTARRRAATTRRAVTAAALTTLATLGALTTGTVAARVEAPRCRGRGACPLYLAS
jgi:hypothetical protein